MTELSDTARAIGVIMVAMAILALVEAAIPLHARGRWHRVHVGPNLVLTVITFFTNATMTLGVVAGLSWLHRHGTGLLPSFPLPPLAAGVLTIVVLDFAFYLAHVAMHVTPSLWRYHRVHHADPAVDVTTTIRQHPGEGVIRYAFISTFSFALGASPGAYAVYRTAAVINALLEHANVRVP